MDRGGGAAGFSLLEALVALVILGLVATAGERMFSHGNTRHVLQAASMSMLSDLRHARTVAMASGTTVEIVFNRDGDGYMLPPPLGVRRLARAVHVSGGETSRPSGGRPAIRRIRFWPTGSTCECELTLSSGSAAQRIRLNWLTGRAELVEE